MSSPVPPVPPTPPTPAPTPTSSTPPSETETVTQAAGQVASDLASDASATEAAVKPLWEQAAAEYHSLAPEIQGRFHQLINDVESLKATSLPFLHRFLSAETKGK